MPEYIERPQNRHLKHDSETQRKRGIRHGYYHEPWYKNYRSMMDRCYCQKTGNYHQYGAVGVSVCEEWHDIENFKRWVDQSGFVPGLTLDRIDGTKGYSPNNCRWATMREQTNNRRNTIFYEYKGERRALTDWADILGISRYTLYSRIQEQGWSVEKAFETPVNRYGERKDGE